MAEGVSRREIVALAGVGLGLSACNGIGAGTDAAAGNIDAGNVSDSQARVGGNCEKLSRDRGICEEWGKYPWRKAAEDTVFEPKFITIVFIDLRKKWRLSVNHASFEIKSRSNDDKRLLLAIKILEERAALPKKLRKFKHITKNAKPFERQNGDLDRNDFSNFGFSTQNEVFIYFNSDEITIDGKWMLTFTPKSDIGDPRDPNYSFLNASVVPEDELTSLPGRMIRVRNYMLDCKGAPIGESNPNQHRSQTYSMNIHFRLKSDGNPISMIIDPDTGNGAGNEP